MTRRMMRAATATSEVRCSACRCLIGYTTDGPSDPKVRRSIYCTRICSLEPTRPTENEVRNAQWEMLATGGIPVTHIARRSGVSHTSVYQVLKRQTTGAGVKRPLVG